MHSVALTITVIMIVLVTIASMRRGDAAHVRAEGESRERGGGREGESEREGGRERER